MLPADLQVLLDQTDANEREAEALVEGLDDRRANWQPDQGRAWSVVQCLDHLARINQFYVEAVLPRVGRAVERSSSSFESVTPGWMGAKFVASLEPPPRRRFTAPNARVVPASQMPVADALAAYINSHTRYRTLVTLCARIDPNRVHVQNPFFRWFPMRVSTVLLVVPAHDRRHLWQARNVLARPEFPGAG